MSDQWIRKIGLTVNNKVNALDLSQLHIKFNVQNGDVETPNNASIRIYNLAKDTVTRLVDFGEFTDITLQAGYVGGANFGVIFSGQIRQFRVGRENATDSFLDILASDGDVFYNQAFLNGSVAKGVTRLDELKRLAEEGGIGTEISLKTDSQHFTIPRGSVQFGMARAKFRDIASTLDATWSIQDGQLVMHDNTGYRGGETVVLNAATGLIGVPEQTNEGMKIQCLLNSKIRIGGLVQVTNDDLAQLYQNDKQASSLAYNSWTNIQQNAALTGNGVYQAFLVEHDGDTRGQNWYTHLICLGTDQTDALTSVKGGV